MLDILRDLVRASSGMKFEVIKVTATDDKTTFEAMNPERSAIMKATSKVVLPPEFNGTYGLSNLSILAGILGMSTMKTDATVELVNNSAGEPVEMKFASSGASAVYRMMAEANIPKQPNFHTPEWDVTIEPTKMSYVNFKEQASVFGSVGGNKVTPRVANGSLMFDIGDAKAANHHTSFAISDCAGSLNSSYKYENDLTLTAMALASSSASISLNLSSKGVMQVTVDTGLLEIDFIFPGHSA